MGVFVLTMRELRCGNCSKLLAKASIQSGIAEIKCERCGKVSRFSFGFAAQVVGTDWNGLGTISVGKTPSEEHQSVPNATITR